MRDCEIVDLEQGSLEWLEFRRSRIGGSDAPTIMGLSPWPNSSPLQLYEEKMHGKKKDENFAMRRGKDLEPVARDLFCSVENIKVTPKVFVSTLRPWQMASLDGISEDGLIAYEAKCGGKELLRMAYKREIPPYYYAQIQHNFCVVNPEVYHYQVYCEEEAASFIVERDNEFIEKMLIAEENFIECLRNCEAPPASEKDFILIQTPVAQELLNRYQLEADFEKDAASRKEEAKEALIAHLMEQSTASRYKIGEVKVSQSRRSSYDYKKMAEEGIEIAKYKRKARLSGRSVSKNLNDLHVNRIHSPCIICSASFPRFFHHFA